MIENIRTIAYLVKPSFLDSFYTHLCSLGRDDLWGDRIVEALGVYYAGLEPLSAGIVVDSRGDSFLLKVALLKPFATELERHVLTLTADPRSQRIDAGQGKCPAPDPTNELCPSAQRQLEYGFKPDYWSNSHHFFMMFFAGYASDNAGTAQTFNHAYENITAAVPSYKEKIGISSGYTRRPNEVDYRIGDQGAIMGDEFNSWFVTKDADVEKLVQEFHKTLCLNDAQVQTLKGQMK